MYELMFQQEYGLTEIDVGPKLFRPNYIVDYASI